MAPGWNAAGASEQAASASGLQENSSLPAAGFPQAREQGTDDHQVSLISTQALGGRYDV